MRLPVFVLLDVLLDAMCLFVLLDVMFVLSDVIVLLEGLDLVRVVRIKSNPIKPYPSCTSTWVIML